MGLPTCQIVLLVGSLEGVKQNSEGKSRHDNVFLRTGYCQVIHNNNRYSHDASVSQDIEYPDDSPESRLSYSLTSPDTGEILRHTWL